MGNSLKAYLVLLLIIFGFIAFVEFTADKPINWAKTYNEKDKIPYGTFILFEELNNLFPESDITQIKTTPYEFFDPLYDYESEDYTIDGTYLHIDEYTTIDEVSGTELATYASKGHSVFIASKVMPYSFLDSLNVSVKSDYSFKGKASLKLENPKFKKDSIQITENLDNIYFNSFDSNKTTVLGQQKIGDSLYPNFIKVNYHDGFVFLHTQPAVFTNFMLLKDQINANYAANCLSYIPNSDILYKSKNSIYSDLSRSKLRYILSKKSLRYAWYLGLTSLVLFLIFNAKRKQRIIKEIKPLENTTVAFTKTIGNLYYETKDHNNLINKKITYFLEYLRRVYFVDTQVLDEKFIKSIALKANKSKSDIQTLVDKIADLRAKQQCTEQDLLDLNTLIEDFYKQ